MFFIGIFSTPLPYLAVFFVYLLGMINYSFHTGQKTDDADTELAENTVKTTIIQTNPSEKQTDQANTFQYHNAKTQISYSAGIHINQLLMAEGGTQQLLFYDCCHKPMAGCGFDNFVTRPPPVFC